MSRQLVPQRPLNKSQQKAVDEGKLVETINRLGYNDFIERYLPSNMLKEADDMITHATGKRFSLLLCFAETMKRHQKLVLDACFNLIQASSAEDYKRSEIKWSPSSKRKEMLLPDMRYLVVCDSRNEVEGAELDLSMVHGFVSFMVTYEDGHEVIYVYEVHLQPELRGQGVGKVLMELVEDVGRKAGVEKCMLTVFKANRKAARWYERCGYGVDDYSPGPRVLRNGTTKEPSYLILSKLLAQTTGSDNS